MNKKNKNQFKNGYTRLVDFGDAILLRTKSASPKLTTGYTIIETMIAISVFLIVIVIGIGALLNAHLVNKKSQNMRSIMDSLSFSMEDMSRNIRAGYNFKCLEKGQTYTTAQLEEINDCMIDGYGLAFESSEGILGNTSDQWVYFVQDGKLFKSTNGLSSVIQMTPDEVFLSSTSNTFSVFGSDIADKQQPLAIIRLVGNITSKGNTTSFSLQTVVSQRKNDN